MSSNLPFPFSLLIQRRSHLLTHVKGSDKSSFQYLTKYSLQCTPWKHGRSGGTALRSRWEWSASRFSLSSPHDSIPNALLLATGVSFRTCLGISKKRKSLFSLTGIEPRFFGRPFRCLVAKTAELTGLAFVFVEFVICLTTGPEQLPKLLLHGGLSSASSFNFQ